MAEKNIFLGKAPLLIVAATLALAGAGAFYDLYIDTPAATVDPAAARLDTSQWPEAPDFAFTDLDGSTHRLSDYKGKIILIDFWATWCPPCITAFPAIVTFAARQNGNVVLIALSSDSGPDPVRAFIKKQSAEVQAALKSPNMHVAVDDAKRSVTRGLFLTEMYPETIVVTPDGRMARKEVGDTQWEKQDIAAFLRTMGTQ